MNTIVSLTSLRGIAAGVVVIYHLAPRISDGIGLEGRLPFFTNGQLMVDFFFMLSGFILAHAYPATALSGQAWSDAKEFFLRRIARIYPAHIFMLAVFLAYEAVDIGLHSVVLGQTDGTWFTGSTSLESLLTNVLLIQAWGLHDTLTWNQPSWSISGEVAAYLLFPLIAWWSPFRRSRGFALGAAAAAILLLGLIQWRAGHLTGGATLAVPVCIAEFTLGVGLYFWVRSERLGTVALAAGQALAVLGIVLLMTLDWADLLLVPLFALLIVCCRDDRGWLAHLLHMPVLVWLGRISYSLYITHYIFIRLFDAPWSSLLPQLQGLAPQWNLAVALLQMALILGFAQATYRFVEVPGRSWIRRRSTAMRASR